MQGCDYISLCTPLSAIWQGWATVAGMSVAPYSLGGNTLADLSRMYSEFKCDRLAASFIPSLATTAFGHVAIFKKDGRSAPNLDVASSNFLPFVLNQRAGVVGPVWQPLSVEFSTTGRWLTTIPLDGTDCDDESETEIFVATNNNVSSGIAPSMGLLRLSYVMSFRGLTRNPKGSLIPLSGQIYTPVVLRKAAVSVGAGVSITLDLAGTDQTGSTFSSIPGMSHGDVYKLGIDSLRSVASTVDINSIAAVNILGVLSVVPLLGRTIYFVIVPIGATQVCNLYSTFENAMTLSNPIVYSVAVTNNDLTLRGMCSLVGNIAARNMQAQVA